MCVQHVGENATRCAFLHDRFDYIFKIHMSVSFINLFPLTRSGILRRLSMSFGDGEMKLISTRLLA